MLNIILLAVVQLLDLSTRVINLRWGKRTQIDEISCSVFPEYCQPQVKERGRAAVVLLEAMSHSEDPSGDDDAKVSKTLS